MKQKLFFSIVTLALLGICQFSCDKTDTQQTTNLQADSTTINSVADQLDLSSVTENISEELLDQDELGDAGINFKADYGLVGILINKGKYDTAFKNSGGDSIILTKDTITILFYPNPGAKDWNLKYIQTRTSKNSDKFPKSRTYEYKNYVNENGKTYNGKVATIQYNHRPKASTELAARLVTVVTNLSVDSATTNGIIRTLDSVNAAGNRMFVYTDTAKTSFLSGNTIETMSKKIAERTAGSSTPIIKGDDETTINGTSKGKNSAKGSSWETTITNILRANACFNGIVPKSGNKVTKLTLANGKIYTVESKYSGTCSKTYQRTITDQDGNTVAKTVTAKGAGK